MRDYSHGEVVLLFFHTLMHRGPNDVLRSWSWTRETKTFSLPD